MIWKKVNLGDVCDIVSGSTPKTGTPEYWGGNIPWATPKDLSKLDSIYLQATEKQITSKGKESCSTRMLPVGSVLFSSRAPIGHVAINKIPVCTNQGFKSLIPDDKKIHNIFLYFWLRANRDYLDGLGNGATFREVSKSIVERVEIPLPPLPEQKRLAAILDKADSLRRQRRESLARLDELGQSLFLELFGDPAINSKQWKVAPLSSCCNRIIDCPHSTPKWTAHGVTCIRTSNLLKGEWDWTDHRFVSEEDYKVRTRRSSIDAGDIILSREGTVGVAAIVNSSMKICMGQRLVQLRPSSENSSAYLLHLLLNELTPARISNAMAGSTSKHLNVGDLRELPVPTPPLKLQNHFAAQIEELEAIKTRTRASLTELDALFASLQERAFSGELSGLH